MAGLFALLDKHALYDGALIAVVSDHGEEFLDHGDFGHPPRVYQELAHVQWLLRLPDARDAGRVIAQPVALLDVAPTLLDLAGLPVPAEFQGRSLRGLLSGSDDGAWLAERALLSKPPTRGAARWRCGAARRSSCSRRATARAELYDLAADPGETRDLAAERPERAAALRAELEAWVKQLHREGAQAGTQAVPNRDPHPSRGALEALGYVE